MHMSKANMHVCDLDCRAASRGVHMYITHVPAESEMLSVIVWRICPTGPRRRGGAQWGLTTNSRTYICRQILPTSGEMIS